VHGNEVGTAALSVAERDGDTHLAAHCRIRRLELVDLDHSLVRHELHEAPVVSVGVRARLACSCLSVVGGEMSRKQDFDL
jgi:hypothetical protein